MRFVYTALVLCFICCSAAAGEKVRFDNFRLYKLVIRTDEQLRVLQNLEQYPSGYIFLEVPVQTNTIVQMLVPPRKVSEFLDLTSGLAIESELKVMNFQQLVDSERPLRRKSEGFGWEDYHTLDEMYAWFDELVENYDDLSIETYGYSYEDREMKALKLSKRTGNPGILIESNIHAREWITSATTTWILNQFLTSQDPAVQDLATNYDWYILPVTNPDGLNYTKEVNRLWRKNRYPHSVLCYGTDMNRNFPGRWMEGGASLNPCSDLHAGPEPGSEIETQNMMAYFEKVKENIDAYFSFHSFGQYMLFPFGHPNADKAENYYDWMEIAEAAAVAISKRHKTFYEFGTTADVLYVATGSSVDWTHGVHGVPISLTFEFRDEGYYGFVLPADQIIPNAEEVLDGLVAFLAKAKELGYFQRRD